MYLCPICDCMSTHPIRCSVCGEFFPKYVKAPEYKPLDSDLLKLTKELENSYACDFHLPIPIKRPSKLKTLTGHKRTFSELDTIKPESTKPHTYTRSAKSKNHGEEFTPYQPIDPALKWDKKTGRFVRARPISANVSGFTNYLGTFEIPKKMPRKKRSSWTGDSVLYDRILRYQVRNCRFLVEQINDKAVYTANDYPCIQIDLSSRLAKSLTVTSYREKFVELSAAILNGYIDCIAFRAGFAMPCVMRSSFGFLTPTTAETGESIRLSLGLAPHGYLLCVIEAIEFFLEDLQHFVSYGLTTPIDVPFFRSKAYSKYRKTKKPLFTDESTYGDYLTSKIDTKKGLLEDAQRTFSGTSLATEHSYAAVKDDGNGITAALRSLLDESLWSLTGKTKNTLSFDVDKKVSPYRYDLAHIDPCRFLSKDDPAFLELTQLILKRTGAFYAPWNDDQFGRWRAAVFAAEDQLLNSLTMKRLVDTRAEDSGSDSEDEFDVPQRKQKTGMVQLKLITQNGMNAIAIALQCTRMWLKDVIERDTYVVDKIPLDKIDQVMFDNESYDDSLFVKHKKKKQETSKLFGNVGMLSYIVEEPASKKKKDKGKNDKGKKKQEPKKTTVPLSTSNWILLTKTASVQHSRVIQSSKEVDLVPIYMERMYFEAPHLLEINRWLSPCDTIKKAEVVLMDANHCETKRPTIKPMSSFFNVYETIDLSELNLPFHHVVIFDVTSATTKKMAELIDYFSLGCGEKALLMLVDSGLKHQQLGTDRNAYGTVRFICNTKYRKQLDTVLNEAKKLSAYRKQSVLSHSVRRAFKSIGATPTIGSILAQRESSSKDEFSKPPWLEKKPEPLPKGEKDLEQVLKLALKLTYKFHSYHYRMPRPNLIEGEFSQFDVPGAGSACSPISILAIATILNDPSSLSATTINDIVIRGGALYQGILQGIEGATLYAKRVQSLKGEHVKEGIHLNPYETPSGVLDQLALNWGGQHSCKQRAFAGVLQAIFESGGPIGVAIVIGGYTVSVTLVDGTYYLFDSHGFGGIKGAFLEKHDKLSGVLSRLRSMAQMRLTEDLLSISIFTPSG